MNPKMKEIIDHNLKKAVLGASYEKAYMARLPTPEQSKKKQGYKRAYKEYIKRKK